MTATCSTCRFWVDSAHQPRNGKTLTDDGGECRKRAPVGGGFTAYLQASKEPKRMFSVIFPWPVSHAMDWCGEHEAKATEPRP